LKEKGEPFKILLLKIADLYLEHIEKSKSKVNLKLLGKLGPFAIDILASVKLTDNFNSNYSLLMSLKALNTMVHNHSFSLSDKLGNKSDLPNISETGLERISSYNSYGWLTRFTQHRDSRIKFMVWNILLNLVSSNLINQHPSLIDQSLE